MAQMTLHVNSQSTFRSYNNKFYEDEVQCYEIGGTIWFKGKELCKILGYKNNRDAIKRHVDNEDKMPWEELRQIGSRETLLPLEHNEQSHEIMVNESGMYSMVLRSRMPRAREFKRWVTNTVLPQIRKYGYFIVKRQENEICSLKQEMMRLQEENKGLNQALEFYWERPQNVQDRFFQQLAPKRSGYIPQDKKEVIDREMKKHI